MRSGGPTFRGADEALDAVDAIVAGAAAEARRAEQYAAAVDGLRVHGRPSDGSDVTVTLDHAGGLVHLAVGERVAAQGGAAVARAVLAANATARRRLPAVLGGLAREAFGADSATTAHVVQHAERMFAARAGASDAAGERPAGVSVGAGVLR
ncbi:hypothetical protein [Nocardioides zeae]|uniref:YbaB/EbfC family nucleoid-associated protein n=1 Tax=Nocardioides zeae TaxID=1457234 RepID=A0AAJ1X1L3_9ACTN|nr:hypothetical protein [Nocardioides zeae]MDQ1105021.1 hypothetical protein [Nocardioides zeae]